MTTEVALWQGELTMSDKNVLGSGALAEVAGPLKDFAEKLGGKEGSLWFEAFKRFLRKEEPWPKFSVWKTIKLGTGLKNAKDFRRALFDGGFSFGNWAEFMLDDSAFTVAAEGITEVGLVKVTVAELGFKKYALYDQIYEHAKELGLKICPREVGPQLRLQYLDQPNDERILIFMERISAPDGQLRIFCVEHDCNGRWLSSDMTSPVHFCHNDQLVFLANI